MHTRAAGCAPGVSPRPVTGTGGALSSRCSTGGHPRATETPPGGHRAHRTCRSNPHPASCPSSPRLTLDKGNLQRNRRLEHKVRNKGLSPG